MTPDPIIATNGPELIAQAGRLEELLALLAGMDLGADCALWQGRRLLAVRMEDGTVLHTRREQPDPAP